MPTANNLSAHRAAWALLDDIEAVTRLDVDVRAVPPYVRAETLQQVALLRAGTLRAALQRQLATVERDPTAVQELAARSVGFAQSALRQLEGLGRGWEVGNHGGDARLFWMLVPQLAIAEAALPVDVVARRMSGSRDRPSPVVSFEAAIEEAAVLLEQCTDREHRPTQIRSELRLVRLDMIRHIGQRDPVAYLDAAASARGLISEATRLSDKPLQGLALGRLMEISEVASEAMDTDLELVPARLLSPQPENYTSSVPRLREMVGIPARSMRAGPRSASS